jgi:hypothetical protein
LHKLGKRAPVKALFSPVAFIISLPVTL